MEQFNGINKDLLSKKMKERGINVSELATLIDMDPSTFYRKLNSDGLKFTIGQMHSIVGALELSNDDAAEIFLGYNSQNCEIGA